MGKLKDANKKIEETVVEGYKKVEETVVGGYKKVENKFVDKFLRNDDETIEEAKERIGNAPIIGEVGDISSYEVIYIMSPIYWGTYAPELETAIKDVDFTGKTIRVITTHEGSGLANVVSDVKKICRGANVLDDAIAIVGSQAKDSKRKIEERELKKLEDNQLTKKELILMIKNYLSIYLMVVD